MCTRKTTLASLAAILLAGGTLLSGQAYGGWDRLPKALPSDGAMNDWFGYSVALSGNIALVGSPNDDDKGSNSGSVYLFNATTGAQTAKLTPSDGAPGDQFGYAVAFSGGTALVGSPCDDDKGSDSGSAYLFNATTGAQIAKLKPADGSAGDAFGKSVALSGDTALIGSRYDDDNGSNSGSAYLFNATTGAQIAKLKPADGATNDSFGWSVAISGNLALVGSYLGNGVGTDTGSAYVFNATTGEQIAKLKASDGRGNDHFGCSVAISGNIALVGSEQHGDKFMVAGGAYLFNATTGEQIAELKPFDAGIGHYFGCAVAISGNTAIVGSYGNHEYGGAAYLFNATTGAQIAKIYSADGVEYTQFGYAVALSGNTALVGSYYQDSIGGTSDIGSAYLFAQDVLNPDPLSGGTIAFSPVERGLSVTLDDVPSIANSGGAGSVIRVKGFAFTGPDADLFDLPGYSNVTLTAGAFDTIAYDLMFLGCGELGNYAATLTLLTDSGNVTYGIQAQVIPEPCSAMLLTFAATCLLRRRARIGGIGQ